MVFSDDIFYKYVFELCLFVFEFFYEDERWRENWGVEVVDDGSGDGEMI